MRFKSTKFNKNVAVESQDLSVNFCFAKQTNKNLYENMSDWSVCRDFMGDVICSMQSNNIAEIYGFQYNPTTHPINTEQCEIGIKFPSASVRKQFLTNLETHNTWITKSSTVPFVSSVLRFVGSPNTLVVVLDKQWQESTVAISLATFLLKSLCWKMDSIGNLIEQISKVTIDTPYGKRDTKEAEYVKGYEQRVLKILKNIKTINVLSPFVHGYTEEQYIHTIHNRSGFYYTARWMQESEPGKWLREQQL